MSKRDHTKLHALRRLKERYGLGDEEARNVLAAIRRKIKRRLKRPKKKPLPDVQLCHGNNGNSRDQWMVNIHGRWYRVVYEAATSRVVTALPTNEESWSE